MPIVLNIRPKNIPAVDRKLASIPWGFKSQFMMGMAVYLLGNSRRGFRHEPPRNFVPRKRAYGRTAFSQRQLRLIHALWAKGEVPYRRTGETANAWQITGSGTNLRLTNRKRHAKYLYSDSQRARQPMMVGWRSVSEMYSDNERGAWRAGEQRANRWMKMKRIT